MNSSVFILISLIIFCAGLTYTFTSKRVRNLGPNVSITYLLAFTASALLPLYISGSLDAPGGPLDTLLTSILGVARSVMGENSVFDTREMLSELPASFSAPLAIYTAVLHVGLSALVLGFILSMFKSFFPKIKYNYLANGNLCVFNTISERTLLLAEDIRKNEENSNEKPAVLVFLDSPDKEESDSAHLFDRLRKTNALLLNTSPLSFKIRKRYKQNSEINFFLLKMDEEENLKEALDLADIHERGVKESENKSKQKDNAEDSCKIVVHILNSNPEAEMIIDAIDYKRKMNFRLTSESRINAYYLLYNYPPFLYAKDNEISVLVLGAGKNGSETVKSFAWCARTLKLKPDITVIDINPEVAEMFAGDCPELSEKTATKEALDETCVRFYTADARSSDLYEILKKHPKVNYIVCALGDDAVNLRTALKVRGIYEELRFTNANNGNISDAPHINVLLNNGFLHSVSSNLIFDNVKDAKCNLNPYGALKETYTWKNIVNPHLSFVGYEINKYYTLDYCKKETPRIIEDITQKMLKELELNSINDAPENVKLSIEAAAKKAVDEFTNAELISAHNSFENKEYKRKSSIASALHCKYKLYSALTENMGKIYPDKEWQDAPTQDMIDDFEAYINDEEHGIARLEELAQLEHLRWNSYMRSAGWRSCDTDMADLWFEALKGHRNYGAKLHPCITSWDNLPNIDNWVLNSHAQVRDFKELDRVLVSGLPEILKEASKAASPR